MLGHAPTYAWYSAECGSGRLGQDEYEADPAASSYTAGGVSERLVDAASMSVDRAIDRMLAQAPGRILYGAWL